MIVILVATIIVTPMTILMIAAVIIPTLIIPTLIIPVTIVTTLMTTPMAFLIMRDILVVIPTVFYKVDTLATGIVFAAVPAPISGVARRDM